MGIAYCSLHNLSPNGGSIYLEKLLFACKNQQTFLPPLRRCTLPRFRLFKMSARKKNAIPNSPSRAAVLHSAVRPRFSCNLPPFLFDRACKKTIPPNEPASGKKLYFAIYIARKQWTKKCCSFYYPTNSST